MRFGIWYQDKSKVVSWYQICVSVCKGSEVVFREAASGWWWRHCRGVFEWGCTSRPWKPEQTGTIWMCQTENKASYNKRASVHTKWQCPSNYWNLGKVIMGVNSTYFGKLVIKISPLDNYKVSCLWQFVWVIHTLSDWICSQSWMSMRCCTSVANVEYQNLHAGHNSNLRCITLAWIDKQSLSRDDLILTLIQIWLSIFLPSSQIVKYSLTCNFIFRRLSTSIYGFWRLALARYSLVGWNFYLTS